MIHSIFEDKFSNERRFGASSNDVIVILTIKYLTINTEKEEPKEKKRK